MAENSLIIENSNQLNLAMKLLRYQAEDTARKDRISRPSQEQRNTNARRRDSVNTDLEIGSNETADISTAIIACTVIRVPKA